MDTATLLAGVDLSTVAAGLGALLVLGLGITQGFKVMALIKKATNKVG